MSENVILDLVIIGAGPAGATAAISALRADASLKLMIVDKAAFPRDKPCGDGLGPGVVSVLREIGFENIVSEELPISGCTVFGPDGTGFSSPLPTIRGQEIVGYVVPRTTFDLRLVQAAKSLGADLREGWRFLGLSQTASVVSLDFETPNGPQRVMARAVIGSDGANSRVRASLNVKRNTDRMTGLAIRAYANVESIPAERHLVFEWSENLLPAYAWYFPASDSSVNIGLGLVVHDRKKRAINLKDHLDSFVSMLEAHGMKVSEVRDEKSYILPHGARIPRLTHGRVMLIGDAGSMINPLSGEGIFYGMAAGVLAGEAIGKTSGNDDPESVFRHAERAFRKRFVWHFRSNYFASVMLRSRSWAKLVIRAASNDSGVLASGVELLFGEGVITASTTRKILWHGLRRSKSKT